ncbi:MAG: hypothetical protein ACYCVN_12350 [Acidimicrobiales bacterium]
MTRLPPGAPFVVGAGPEQAQQRNPLGNYMAAAPGTAVPNEVTYPIATATDIQNPPTAGSTNILAVATAPPGIAAWFNPTKARDFNLDGASPS